MSLLSITVSKCVCAIEFSVSFLPKVLFFIISFLNPLPSSFLTKLTWVCLLLSDFLQCHIQVSSCQMPSNHLPSLIQTWLHSHWILTVFSKYSPTDPVNICILSFTPNPKNKMRNPTEIYVLQLFVYFFVSPIVNFLCNIFRISK